MTQAATTESVAEVIISDLDVTLETSKQKPKHKAKEDVDHVREYAKDVLSMGLLYSEFQDIIREGAGKRVLVVWNFFCYFSWLQATLITH